MIQGHILTKISYKNAIFKKKNSVTMKPIQIRMENVLSVTLDVYINAVNLVQKFHRLRIKNFVKCYVKNIKDDKMNKSPIEIDFIQQLGNKDYYGKKN